MALVECDFSQADPKPKVLWSGNPVHEAITPPVILNGYLYGLWIDNREESWELSGKPSKGGFLSPLHGIENGETPMVQAGIPHGPFDEPPRTGTCTFAAHRTVTLIEANPTAYVETGRIEKVHNAAEHGAPLQRGLLDWNMPVIARGRLYIRTPVEIICYDITDHATGGAGPK